MFYFCASLKCLCLQKSSLPPTWVIGSNLRVVLNDTAQQMPERLSPYAVKCGPFLTTHTSIDVFVELFNCTILLQSTVPLIFFL